MGKISDKQRTTPYGMLRQSKELLAAYRTLEADNSNLTNQFATKYFLLGRSLELVLKAFLLHLNYELPYLKKLGHDLNLLAATAYYRYRPFPIGLKEIAVISMLNEHYLAKDFEYPKIGSKRVPKIADITNLIEKLHEVADQNITIPRRQSS